MGTNARLSQFNHMFNALSIMYSNLDISQDIQNEW